MVTSATKLSIEVRDEFVHFTQEGRMTIPRCYLYELVETLMNPLDEGLVYYYHSYGVAFGSRSCRLIRSTLAGCPETVATLKRSSIPKLVAGLVPHLDGSYLGATERENIDHYLSSQKAT